MTWPTPSYSKPPRRSRLRRPRRPPGHIVTVRQHQRRTRHRVALRIVAVIILAIVLPLALAVVVVVAIGRANRPAAVPKDWEPPVALPRAANPLPVDQMLFASDRAGTYGIYAMRLDGQGVRPVSVDSHFDSWGVRLSPDRATAIFYRTPPGSNRDAAVAGLWAVAADGTAGPLLLRPAGLNDWVVQTHAEWDIYGSSLIMSGGDRNDPKLYVTDALGQGPRPFAPRPGPAIDPTYTPNGQEVLFVGCPRQGCDPQERELFRVPSGGGEAVRLTNDRRREREPYVSPQGDKVVWVAFEGAQPGDGWQLRMGNLEGGGLTHQRSLLAMAGEDVVGRPQWSLDGNTIFVHRKASGRATTGIWAISTNTTAAPRELTLAQPGNQEDPSL